MVLQRFPLCPIESNGNENFKVIQNPGQTQTNRQTNKQSLAKHYLLGGGNKSASSESLPADIVGGVISLFSISLSQNTVILLFIVIFLVLIFSSLFYPFIDPKFAFYLTLFNLSG